jgi:ribosomal protein S6
MKYLSNRDQFLKRSINKIDEYKSLESKDLEVINEGDSGPFANDIPWNDSLLGRLINSTIRKAKIGANLVRIKAVNRRLKDAFDDLLGQSAVSGLSKEEKAEFNKVVIFSFLENLKNSIESEGNVGEIKRLTEEAIKNIKEVVDKTPADELSMDKDDLLKLIKQLEDFKKFLDQFKDDEGGDTEFSEDDSNELESEDEEGGKGDGNEGSKSSESIYPTMVKTLKSLASILSHYKEVKIIDAKNPENLNKEKIKYTTVSGDTIKKIADDTKVNIKKLTSKDIIGGNQQVVQNGQKVSLSTFFNAGTDKSLQSLPAGLVLVMEGYNLLEALGGSPDRANIKGGEDHLTQAFTNLKKAIEVLESPKDKGIGVDVKFLNDITSKSLDSKNKEIIKSLFTEINRYLVGDKKETLNAPTVPLYKESIEIISDKNKKIVVAEKIARFAKTALKFDKEGLYGGLGETGKGLQAFVEGIKSIMNLKTSDQKVESSTTVSKFKVGDIVKWKNKEGKEISKKIEKVKDGSYFFTTSDGKEYSKKESELTKESIISKYNKFLSYIKEAEETEETGEVSDPVNMTTSQKIKDWWDKKIDIKEFVLTRSQSEKIRIAIEKAGKTEAVTISGLDPIIEIVKVFNRAYKLHTTQVISTGRAGGKVSNKTFMEYTSFGGGSPESAGSSGGPYRNNAIFNQWENAVQNIKKETKYQKIFREETVIKTSDDNIIKDAGKNLLKFMNDMLDGDTLYKGDTRGTSGQGKQAEFIEKYFSPTDADKKKLEEGGLAFGGKKEEEEINGVAKNMPKEKNLDFTDKLLKFESNDDLSGTFFAAKTMLDGKSRQIYFYIQSIEGEYAYVSYCGTMGFFKKYIIESGNTIKMEKNKLDYAIKTELIEGDNKQYIIKGLRIKLSSLISKEGKFNLIGSKSIKFIQSFDGTKNNPYTKSMLSDKEDVMNFQSFFTLQEKIKDEKGQETFKRFKIGNPSNSIKTNGGFINIVGANDIKNTSVTNK